MLPIEEEPTIKMLQRSLNKFHFWNGKLTKGKALVPKVVMLSRFSVETLKKFHAYIAQWDDDSAQQFLVETY